MSLTTTPLIVNVNKVLKLILFVFTVVLILTITIVGVNASEDKNIDQPYKIVKSDVIDSKKINNLLIVASIEPKESEFYETYNKKIKNLAEIIHSHWEIKVEIIDIADYQKSYLKNFDALFLIEEYGRTIPYHLFRDLLNSEKQEIIWSGFGSEELVVSLLKRYLSLRVNPPNYEEILYKKINFLLGDFNFLSRFELPQDSQRINAPAYFINKEGKKEPIILDIDERFLVLPFEIPFSYSIDDYSLVFLDSLHRSLGHHNPDKKALLRLEDIDAYTYRRTGNLSEAYDYLKSESIPFHIALIARYINPEKGLDLEIGDRFFLKQLLTKMASEGYATLVQHGYTHQKGDGVSAYDYEFWDEEKGGPLEYDSEEFVTDRLIRAQEIMKKNHLPVPEIWETPHYTLSDLDARVINSFYPLRYESLPNLGRFPFTIQKEREIYFPENLGYVDSEKDLERIEEQLKRVSVFEDPVASFFWHPWRETDELKQLITILQESGYEFVSVYDLVEHNDPIKESLAPSSLVENKSLLLRYQITEFWLGACFTLFSYGGFLYFRNIVRIGRYFRKIKKNKVSLARLKKLAKMKKTSLPTIAIFIPARMEGYVIENTLRRLAKINYPKKNFKVLVIADERDLEEKPELLTKEIAKRVAIKLNRLHKFKFIHCLEVPKWYSGKFGTRDKKYKHSSKGRALNWALQQVYYSKQWKEIDMIGVLDADGRYDTNVLKEVAYKRLKNRSRLLQGPVFQVSNFGKVSLIGIVAGLELAIHHMSKLAHRLIQEKDRPQFLAGTNYFVDKNLIIAVGGWNDDALVEDAELALRSYIKKRVVAHWLSWPETEQTPPNFSVYRKQRDRWVRGHLDLIGDIKQAEIPLRDKVRFLTDIYLNMFRVFIDLGVPVIGWTLMLSGILLDLGPILRAFSFFLLVMSFFIWDFYGYMYRKLYSLNYIKNIHSSSWQGSTKLFSFHPFIFLFNGGSGEIAHKFIQSVRLIFFMPIFIFAQSIPRITGSYKYLLKVGQKSWYKTERTKEEITE